MKQNTHTDNISWPTANKQAKMIRAFVVFIRSLAMAKLIEYKFELFTRNRIKKHQNNGKWNTDALDIYDSH